MEGTLAPAWADRDFFFFSSAEGTSKKRKKNNFFRGSISPEPLARNNSLARLVVSSELV